MNKKVILLISLMLLLLLCACGEKQPETKQDVTSVENTVISDSSVKEETTVSEPEQKPEEEVVLAPPEPEILEIPLEYVHGEDISEFDNWLFVDVNKFDLFKDKLKIIVDATITADENTQWPEIGLMTTWDNCKFYYDLNRHSRGILPNDAGKQKTFTFDLSAKEFEGIKTAGVLRIVGAGFSVDGIKLVGEKNLDYIPPETPDDSPVMQHGRLRVEGQSIIDEHGEEIRLLGTAPAWDYMDMMFQNSRTYSSLRDNWGMNCIRIQIEPHADDRLVGYMDPYANRDMLNEVLDIKIQACLEAGMYALIDYHSYFNPLDTEEGAIEFFKYVSEKYGDCPNIIYELANEPFYSEEWKHVKEYADTLIPIIRENAPSAMIVIPTAGWDDGVLKLAKDPVKHENIIYSYHEYTSSMWNYDRVKSVLEKGVPIFFTEFSYVDSDDGVFDDKIISAWKGLLDKYNCSYNFHSIIVNYDNYDCSHRIGIVPSCNKRWDWEEEDMGDAMKVFYHVIRKDAGLE